MPTVQEQSGSYRYSWLAVSAALWDKYEGHPYITDVEVVSRRVDEAGRLHSRRLLTMEGRPPPYLRPLIGDRPMYIQEDIIVDPTSEKVSVQTRTLNFSSIIDSRSRTHYWPSPSNKNHTDYTIWVRAAAFPGKENESLQGEAAFQNKSSGSSWGLGLGLAVEDFTAKKLLGNVKQGEDKMNELMEKIRRRCNETATKPWLCRAFQ